MARLVGVLLYLFASAALALMGDADFIEVDLIAETTSVQPGEPFQVGLRLHPEENWKTYWHNPGDAGLPTRIAWRLPEGVSAGDIQWGYPERFDTQGAVSYGYDGEVLLFAEMQPSADLVPGTVLSIEASTSWLICDDVCIPGSAELSLTLPVEDSLPRPDLRWTMLFEEARRQLPQPLANAQAGFEFLDDRLHLQVQTNEPLFANARDVTFYPEDSDLIRHSAPGETDWHDHWLRLQQPQSDLLKTVPDTFDGVLVIDNPLGTAAYRFTATAGLQAIPGAAGAAPGFEFGLLQALLLALAGGVLLNLMPCVFPVLSLKAISLMEARGISLQAQRWHGIAYTAGVMLFFAVVAAILYLLKLAGVTAGWGFQLQAPWFVALLAYLLFVLGLGFSGLLELGTRFMGVGESLTHKGGYGGSFFTGALAAVVASPCTAPFMGTAIAFAVTQPPLYSLTVFLALGFGMAAPFLLIGFVPRLGRLLPRPGAWMNTFKQAMAFPLYLTALWLLWVLGRQTDATGMAVVLTGMLLIVFAIWLRRLPPAPTRQRRHLNSTLALAAALGALALLLTPPLQQPAPVFSASGDTKVTDDFWVPYNANLLAELRSEGQPVFVNMTADWCISCIANEQVALRYPAVRQAFGDKGIVAMKGDWTNGDPEITRVLESFGRNGVPLYVLYPASPDGEPRLLPQWLSPMNVLEALDRI